MLLDHAYTTGGPKCSAAFQESGGQIGCHFVDLRQPFASTGSVSGSGPWTNIAGDGAGQTIIAPGAKLA